MPWMVDEEAPLTASAVAPPALIEWPLIFSVGTSLRRRRVNQLREGMDLMKSESEGVKANTHR